MRNDELLTADRNFYSYPAWASAASTGAALLWRAPTQLELPVVRVLADGTYLTMLSNPRTHKRERRDRVVAAAGSATCTTPSQVKPLHCTGVRSLHRFLAIVNVPRAPVRR